MTILFWASSALAATWTVGSSGADYTSIQDAIDGAANGDTIQVASGTYAEALDLSGLTLTISATSGSGSTTLQPPSGDTAVKWILAEGGTLDGFTIEPTKGRAFEIKDGNPSIQNCIVLKAGPTGSQAVDGGGAHIDGATPTFDTVTFTENEGRFGGSIYAKGGASVELIDVTFTDSKALFGGALFAKSADFTGTRVSITDPLVENSGGGIYIDDGTLEIAEGVIENASGEDTWGAGIFARNGSTVVLTNGSITNSSSTKYTAGYEGGAIRLEGSGTTLACDGTQFDQNKAYRGGAISLGANTQANLVNVTLSNHEAHLSGGAISIATGAHLHCDSCSIEDNSAPVGGAIAVDANGLWTDVSSVMLRNAATAEGGAAYVNEPATLDLTGTRLENNQAEAGGALYILRPNSITMTTPVFKGNQATAGDGGAIHVSGTGVVEISDGRFSSNLAQNGGGIFADGVDGLLLDWVEARTNSATSSGGAIYVSDVNESHIQRSLFFNNGAGSSGGAWFESNGTVFSKLQTSVWQENTAAEGGAIYMNGSLGTEMINNTLVGNTATTAGDHAVLLGTPVRFINNIAAYGDGTGGIHGDSGTAASGLFWYNDVWNNKTDHYTGDLSDPTGTDGNLSVDPLLRAYTLDGNESNDDLHLQTTSPCIDTGWSAIKDVDGTDSDMGAYGGSNPRTFDNDGDGFSDLADCDDTDASIYPGATEIPYDGIDQDCDGSDLTDVDKDGYDWDGVGGDDCNDDDPDIHPNATEIWYDGIDQNCDGASDYDKDQDGYLSDAHGGDDCNDDVATIYPGAPEAMNDGVDQDCDGTDAIDADGDGHASPESGGDDCDDTRAEAYPGAEEQLNGLDDDCDGYPETADRDEDGLQDFVEWDWGTNPNNPDTDGDTLLDGEEGDPDEDPWDTDEDGLINPMDADDDGDGIPTETEASLPDPDMDGDGLPSWMDTDTDGDGKSDEAEGLGDADLDGKPDYADYDGDYTGGCVGGKSLVLFAILPLFWRRPQTGVLTAFIGLMLFAVNEEAYASGPDAHNLEWMNIAGSDSGTPRVAHPTLMGKGFAFGGSLESAYRPLQELGPNGPSAIVQQMSTMSVGAAFSPIEGLQWELLLPVHFDVTGNQGRRAGLGDGRISSKVALLESDKLKLALSAQAFAWLPTGRAVLHHGNGDFAGGGLIAFGQEIGLLKWSLNLGARFGRLKDTRNILSSHGPMAGLAIQIQLPKNQTLFTEILSHGSSGWQEWPLEFGAGVTLDAPKSIWSSAALYVSPSEATGVPVWRISLTAGWSKTKRPIVEEAPPPPVAPPPPPTPKPPPPAEISDDRIVIHQQIRFEEGSAKLKDADNQPVLFAVLGILSEHPEIQHLLIIGHTNHHGTPEVNQRLSEARAKSVLNWLTEQGVAADRLLHKGVGSTQPKVPIEDPDAESINRRVEFKVLRE